MNSGMPVATVAAVVLTAVATVVVGAYGVRMARTTSDFLVASRTVSSRWNAAAISGEYLSAASFLGVAGLIAKYGADALWYPIGFTAGYLGLLLFVAAPLRRSGAYTVPDFAEFRLGSTALRKLAMVVVIIICVLYTVPQFQGAGLALGIVLGIPRWVGAAAVGLIVIANVVGGGMRSITFVQAFQYWLKLTAIAIPALVLAAHLLGANPFAAPAGATTAAAVFAADTTVSVTTTVRAEVGAPITVLEDGAARTLAAGEHEFASGTEVVFPAGATVPGIAATPPTTAAWMTPGWGFGGAHPLFQVLSLIVGIFLGTMGLPHVLVRFYTNPDGRAARATALSVIALLGLFYLFPTILGVLTRLWAPQLLLTGASDAAVLLLPGALLSGWVGQSLAALVAAGAIAAFLSTSSGLLVSVAGVLSTDVLPGRVRDFRFAAVLAGAVPLALAIFTQTLDLSRIVGLVFAVAASTLCPLLMLGIWWRGLTAAGAAAGMTAGGLVSGAAILVTAGGGLSAELWDGWPAVIVSHPAAVTVPLAFLVMIGVSLATRKDVPRDVARLLTRMHVPEKLGVGADRETRLRLD
ncbi:sodium/solute symporter [Tomitella biformata]|uniref:sodium/solute symporter n=1 Tax=Tomitella biformata TaxID=630403 RepID=UPI000463428F|nr:cation acetate symporter [Tomitella biformata]